ncbi:uncharacterized protein LOC134711110 [Mytilus trossulus]|uniref:uncharacterized protein LOC134711110 n=1 Tax=Mytilus trossulus TaxID=6551 RepID=UPI0030066B18
MLELQFYITISSLIFFCVGLHAAAVDDEMKSLRDELLEIRNSYKILVHRMNDLEKTNAVLQKCGCQRKNLAQTSNKNDEFINLDGIESKHSNQTVWVPNHTKRLSVSDKVAFRAYVTEHISNLGDNQIIPFRSVPFDSHRAFHGDSGVFTSPKSGLYAFFCTILVYPGQRLEFELLKDGHVLAYGGSYGNQAEHKDYGSGTTSTVVQLNSGEKMYVRVHGNNHPSAGQIIFQGFSYFMGFSLD